MFGIPAVIRLIHFLCNQIDPLSAYLEGAIENPAHKCAKWHSARNVAMVDNENNP